MRKSQRRHGERGAVAVVVALCLVMLVAVAGVAIDVGRVLYVRGNLQLALDGAMKAAGAASVSLGSGLTNRQIELQSQRVARRFIAGNFRLPAELVTFAAATDFTLTYTPQDPDNPNANNEDSVVGTINATVPTAFAGVLGITHVPIQLTARVKRPRPAPVEMVIVADLTQSMAERFGSTTKVAALKSSAAAMVTALMKGDSDQDRVAAIRHLGPDRERRRLSQQGQHDLEGAMAEHGRGSANQGLRQGQVHLGSRHLLQRWCPL